MQNMVFLKIKIISSVWLMETLISLMNLTLAGGRNLFQGIVVKKKKNNEGCKNDSLKQEHQPHQWKEGNEK